jgi:hypothetical protein
MALMADAAYDPQALLSKPLDEIKPPVPYPVGSYVGTVMNREFDTAKTEKKQTIVRFMVRFDEPLPDVDEEEWARATNEAEGGKKPADNLQRLEFWITPDALYRLKQFGEEHCKVDPNDVSNTAELIEAIVGRQAVFVMTQQPNKKNPQQPYHNITATAPVPE